MPVVTFEPRDVTSFAPADDANCERLDPPDVGVTLLDTGDYYGMGHNELLLENVVVARASAGRTAGRPAPNRASPAPSLNVTVAD
jgi:hypothetical protein